MWFDSKRQQVLHLWITFLILCLALVSQNWHEIHSGWILSHYVLALQLTLSRDDDQLEVQETLFQTLILSFQ